MSKVKHRKQTKKRWAKVNLLRRRLPWPAWLLIVLAIVGVVVFVRLYTPGQPPAANAGIPRAAIVDQLSVLQENPAFIAEVTSQLEGQGFEVDLYQGDEITVDFYRKLPTHGYRVIVFRAHSGILEEDETVHLKTTLFTNEKYSGWRYLPDQERDRLFRATIGEDYDWVFSISPKFIRERMTEDFNDTVIIMMGCAGIRIHDLAEAFIDKGASAYLAWDASVLLHYVDAATLHLIDQLCSEKVTIQEAVDSTMAVIGPDRKYGAELQYHPSGTGGKTLQELCCTP